MNMTNYPQERTEKMVRTKVGKIIIRPITRSSYIPTSFMRRKTRLQSTENHSSLSHSSSLTKRRRETLA
jgi:hypothetical protein